MKRQARCSYCYTTGHNRTSCPTAKQNAAAGDDYAARIVERSKEKKCSYCKGTDHTKATCEKLYTDEKLTAQKRWVHGQVQSKIIESRKIGNGALIYGPVPYAWHSRPYDSLRGEEANYENINYVIDSMNPGNDSNHNAEESLVIFTSTLAEPEKQNQRFNRSVILPDYYATLLSTQTEYGAAKDSLIERINDRERYNTEISKSRTLVDETFQVIMEASEEEIKAAKKRALGEKPLILQYPDRKSYQKAARAKNKAEKSQNGE